MSQRVGARTVREERECASGRDSERDACTGMHRRAQRERASGGAGKKKRSTEADTSPTTNSWVSSLTANMSRRAGVPAASASAAGLGSFNLATSSRKRWLPLASSARHVHCGGDWTGTSTSVGGGGSGTSAGGGGTSGTSAGGDWNGTSTQGAQRSTAQGRRGGLGRSSRPSAAPTRRPP